MICEDAGQSGELEGRGQGRPPDPAAASGCRASLPGPLQAAFVVGILDFEGRKSPQRTHKLGLALSNSLHILSSSLHQPSVVLEVPEITLINY